MNEKIEKLKCEICEKECWVLYPIIFGRDNFLAPRKGVCRACFDKAEELDKEMLMKSKKVAEQYLQESEDQVFFWKKTLDEINQGVHNE
jgi:hypothetical protein